MNVIDPNFSDDAVLLQQLEQGSKHAFNILFEKYWAQAYESAHKRLKDPDLSKDVVQEIFTHIWFKKDTLHIDNFPAYLNVAIRNRVLKQIAKQNLTHPFFGILENMPSTYLQADANLQYKEFFKSYEALVSTLPAKRLQIFRLRFQDDLPTKDIATQLGLSRKTVQNQLGKAIEQLRVSLLQLLASLIILFDIIWF